MKKKPRVVILIQYKLQNEECKKRERRTLHSDKGASSKRGYNNY